MTDNLDQDLGWAPTRYPGLNTYDTGEWRVVVESDTPVALIYTNRVDSSGVSWLRQTESVMEMQRMFLDGAATGTPASDAYAAVESKYEELLRPMAAGDVAEGVRDTMRDMMAQLDARS